MSGLGGKLPTGLERYMMGACESVGLDGECAVCAYPWESGEFGR